MSSSRDKRYEIFSGSGASIASIPNSQRRRHNMMTIASSQFPEIRHSAGTPPFASGEGNTGPSMGSD